MSVLVCGSLHHDIIVAAPHLPQLDETVTGDSVTYAFGGKGGNQAVAAARMGASTAMAGAVGDDAAGARMLADLAAAGVDATQVATVAGPTGMSVAIMDASGGYGAVIVSAANLLIDGAAVTIPQGTTIVILQNEIPEAVNIAVATRARAAGARVILNAAPMRDTARDLTGLIDILIVNWVEAEQLLGGTKTGLSARIADLSIASAIVTLGERGLILVQNGQEDARPAFPVTLVSSHGAGDAFIGALAARLDAGASLAEAAGFAQAAAALHVSTPVAARAGITPAQVLQRAAAVQD